MGGDLYTTAGGSLKLKGVAGSKVEKRKRKKKKVESEAPDEGKADAASSREAQDDASALSAVEDVSPGLDADSGKTEAERRHEDLRRQRVCSGT